MYYYGSVVGMVTHASRGRSTVNMVRRAKNDQEGKCEEDVGSEP